MIPNVFLQKEYILVRSILVSLLAFFAFYFTDLYKHFLYLAKLPFWRQGGITTYELAVFSAQAGIYLA
jgi:hypothetical protein